MLDLRTLQFLDKMPALYRAAIDRRCRTASGYRGKRPFPEQLLEWAPDGAVAEAVERLRSETAAQEAQLTTLRVLWTEARRRYRASRSIASKRSLAAALEQVERLKKRRARLEARIAAGRRRLAYHKAYAGIVAPVVRHLDLKLLPLIDGPAVALIEAARERADAHRFFLLEDLVEDGRLDGEEMLALVEPRRVRRALRRKALMAGLHLGCLLGQVGRVGEEDWQLYAPDAMVAASREQNRRTRGWAERHVLVERGADGRPVVASEPGDRRGPLAIKMTEVMAEQVKARFATLWSLVSAIEQHAEAAGLDCLFVTLTLPPDYHANPTHGSKAWDPALSPVRGAEELQERWHRLLCRARKAGLPALGLWTLEPHKDGTPHRHAMLWLAPEQVGRFERFVRDEFPDPFGAEGVAATVKRWERRAEHGAEDGATKAARPASYIIKYLVKTFIGGEALVDKARQASLDRRHLENPERIQAWRRGLGGKRMYDFVGLRRGAIAIWHNVAKLREGDTALDDPYFGGAWRAIKAKRGAEALALLELLADGAAAEATPAVEIVRAEVVDGEGRPVEKAVALLSRKGGTIGLISNMAIVPAEALAARANDDGALSESIAA